MLGYDPLAMSSPAGKRNFSRDMKWVQKGVQVFGSDPGGVRGLWANV